MLATEMEEVVRSMAGRELELGNPALLDGRILFAPARGRELKSPV